MSKRNNVVDNFEECYLRINCAKKAFANTEQVNRLMASPDFQRCVKYMANITFNKNRSNLLRHGFDLEDIMSVVQILAVQFVNSNFDGKTRKDTYYVLMHFISQKMETFMVFLNRKFRISERHAEISLEDALGMGMYHGEVEIPSDMTTDDEVPESKISQRIGKLKVDLKDLRSMMMKHKLESNLPAYRDRLAELATSKVVDFIVRKKARSVCKKNGIDYVVWAKEQIRSKNLSESDFVLK